MNCPPPALSLRSGSLLMAWIEKEYDRRKLLHPDDRRISYEDERRTERAEN